MRRINNDSMDSTLGNWFVLSRAMFGIDSPASKYLLEKMIHAEDGSDTEVTATQTQMVAHLQELNRKGEPVDFAKPLPATT